MFDIQRFGDTLTADNSLTLVFANAQNKTHSVKVPNPKSTINATTIKEVMTFFRNNLILHDPKTDTSIDSGWTNKTAYKTEKTIRTLDLTPEL